MKFYGFIYDFTGESLILQYTDHTWWQKIPKWSAADGSNCLSSH